MKIQFIGGVRSVTGSSYLVTADSTRILVDCGMFQGVNDGEKRNLRPFPFKPSEIDAVLLTHSHIDHSGLIPKLVKDGFKGKIFATRATADLCGILLLDSAHIHERDAEWETRKRMRKGKKAVAPLYTIADAAESLSHIEGIDYDVVLKAAPNMEVRFKDAGHILGSAILELWVMEKGRKVKIVFSGDLGNRGAPIVKDPTYISDADYILIESTYGNRQHKGMKETIEEFAGAIGETLRKGGNVIIPSFAVGRTQDILYILNQFSREGRLNNLNVFIDSPLATNATRVFLKHPECFDKETLELITKGQFPKGTPILKFSETPEESMSINRIKSGAIIIASSGMCEAGRVRHHLKHNLWREECSIVFVGFQAQGTLGRQIVDGAKTVKLFGEVVAVRARVYTIGGLSAHADKNGLMDWLTHFNVKPKKIFVVHGEEKTSIDFAQSVHERFLVDTHVPRQLEEVSL
ncbi:MAG: MBL fold hydrolase [Nitrospinae bacterium RIFCSPLOWO2_02_39_17]|nr:MAG: MBL fold hydrolase [Nitrospinae bacterium RIFCSPHIGHO2_12_FULL_39_42]OGW05986.1 MAG: MBL fold hydrolase [Nitrospinae bacterium RIFCSPLOWO2_02_39_17]OGW11786.1 MAG: MBL fold hydrolase [Nitrospinae bacterium RIFCSPLOWO2_12_39_15]